METAVGCNCIKVLDCESLGGLKKRESHYGRNLL